MSKVNLRKNNQIRRKLRVKKKIFGTPDKPRLSVYRSNKYSYAQLIDDTKGTTLIGLTLTDVVQAHKGKTKLEASFEIGKMLGDKAKKKKISQAVFDRNGYKYHGRVKKIAEGAREGGLTL